MAGYVPTSVGNLLLVILRLHKIGDVEKVRRTTKIKVALLDLKGSLDVGRLVRGSILY